MFNINESQPFWSIKYSTTTNAFAVSVVNLLHAVHIKLLFSLYILLYY